MKELLGRSLGGVVQLEVRLATDCGRCTRIPACWS